MSSAEGFSLPPRAHCFRTHVRRSNASQHVHPERANVSEHRYPPPALVLRPRLDATNASRRGNHPLTLSSPGPENTPTDSTLLHMIKANKVHSRRVVVAIHPAKGKSPSDVTHPQPPPLEEAALLPEEGRPLHLFALPPPPPSQRNDSISINIDERTNRYAATCFIFPHALSDSHAHESVSASSPLSRHAPCFFLSPPPSLSSSRLCLYWAQSITVGPSHRQLKVYFC